MIEKPLFITPGKIKYLGINLILEFIWKNKHAEILRKTLKNKNYGMDYPKH